MLTHVKHCKNLYARGQQGLYDSQQRMDKMQNLEETLDMQHRLDLSCRVAEIHFSPNTTEQGNGGIKSIDTQLIHPFLVWLSQNDGISHQYSINLIWPEILRVKNFQMTTSAQ